MEIKNINNSTSLNYLVFYILMYFNQEEGHLDISISCCGYKILLFFS